MTTKTKPKTRLEVSPAAKVYKLDGEKIPSVTTILQALPKSLTQWAADSAANYAVEHWADLAEWPLTKRIDKIRYAHRDIRDKAAVRGTQIHKWAEATSRGDEVEIPAEHRGAVQAWVRFLDKWEIEIEATEFPICNLTHRFAGRGDMIGTIGRLGGVRAMVDLKTGNNVYESTVLQLAGYDGAEIWQPDGPDSEQPYEPVEALYVAHILPDDVRMLPVVGGQFRAFLYVQQVSQWLGRHGYKGDEPLIGEAIQP